MQTVELDMDASRERIIDLTSELERFCSGQGDGLVNVFVPHATAGVALMETGSGSDGDLLAARWVLCVLGKTGGRGYGEGEGCGEKDEKYGASHNF